MRAVFIKDIDFAVGEAVELEKDVVHHFNNVLKLKKESNVLILDGAGAKFICEILQIDKKKCEVRCVDRSFSSKKIKLHFYIGTPKKEYLESMIRSATELGADTINTVSCEFSQKYTSSEDRIHKIIKSAIEQSNNPYYPKFRAELSWNSFLKEISQKENVLNFSLRFKKEVLINNNLNELSILIGPEGGFSEQEEHTLNMEGVNFVSLPTPILKAVTALPAATGYALNFLN